MKDQKSQISVRTLAYMALYVALYVVLKWVGNMIPFLQMPNGGSIELELIAVFIASYHLGWKGGVCVALLSWLISFVLGFRMWLYYPIQIILDYVGPLVVCGMASLIWPFKDMKAAGNMIMSLLIAAGTFFGIVNSWGSSVTVYIVSALCAAAVFAFTYWYLKEKKRFGIVIAMLLKYFLQVLSGVYYWFPEETYAGSTASWIFSLNYNLWYNLVSMAVCIIAVPLLIERLEKTHISFKY